MPGIDAYTKLCCHLNTDFTDSSASAHTVTANGSAAITSGQKKFGAGSCDFPGGSGDYLSIPDSADWNFGSGDFTIDTWVRFDAMPSVAVDFYTQYVDSENLIEFQMMGSILIFQVCDAASWSMSIICSHSMGTAQWYHLAFCRSSSVCKIYVDGVSQTLTTNDGSGATLPNLAASALIGIWSDGSECLDGCLDEYRISKGIGRWTDASFTPPDLEYSQYTTFFARVCA